MILVIIVWCSFQVLLRSTDRTLPKSKRFRPRRTDESKGASVRLTGGLLIHSAKLVGENRRGVSPTLDGAVWPRGPRSSRRELLSELRWRQSTTPVAYHVALVDLQVLSRYYLPTVPVADLGEELLLGHTPQKLMVQDQQTRFGLRRQGGKLSG